jgi:hypothetical protein
VESFGDDDRFFEEVLGRAKEALRVRALRKGLPLPDGRWLMPVESTRRTVDVSLGMWKLDHPILEHYGDVITGVAVALLGVFFFFIE